jgi:hypothetical protein
MPLLEVIANVHRLTSTIPLAAMAFEATTILQLMLRLTWHCLSITPAYHKNPLFTLFFTTFDVFKQLASATSLVFADDLLNALQDTAPPTISFFKTLPTNVVKRWGVYLIMLEKSGCRPLVYIGSGTESSRGIAERFSQYERSLHLPRYVEKALHEGYTIMHKGLLCWTAIPSAAMQPTVCLFFLTL